MSIPIFRTDNKALRTLGISPEAYGWLSVAVAWITRGKWVEYDHLDELHNQWPVLSNTVRDIVRVVKSSEELRELLITKHWRI